ncbi:PLP-dependent transferase [Anaerocolumna aminovalerica]|nr:PLP-dependent transferase [Anaerocolumna aminovalerica]
MGLPTHKDYEVSKRQGTGFSYMISFEVDTEETTGLY